jgi:phosphoglycolate phosphatase
MKLIDLMIFDFDGTLVNSGADIAVSVSYTLEKLGLPGKDKDAILSYIGDGVQTLIEKSLGEDCLGRFEEAMEIFSSYYAKHMLDTTALYDCVIDILQHFSDKKKIIITNKRKHFTTEMACSLGLTEYFEEIIGVDSTPYKKPDPRLLQPFLDQYNATPDKTIVIGDGINDILLARHSGVQSCALLRGLTHRKVLLSLEPDYCCEDISELKKLFQ